MKLKTALQQIVPHAFGDHASCGEWCGFNKSPNSYKHSSLPYGRDLVGEAFRADLDKVFENIILNVDKIAPGASTRDVESFNNMLASKAAKRCHYSASNSLKKKVNCAVAQKNIGSSYVNIVNKTIGISPGKFYSKLANIRDKRRVKRLFVENSKEYKQRRIERKLKYRYETAESEQREGTTYMSGITNSNLSDLPVTEIPPPSAKPFSKKVETNQSIKLVFCDIETTSLHKTCDIIQLAAVCGENQFDQYILQCQTISSVASQVTGLSVIGKQLFHNGKPVNSETLKNVLQMFLTWLQSLGKVLLIGHDFLKFDLPRIIRSLEICCLLDEFLEIVVGSVDTLILFKKLYPELECYKQEYLLKRFLDASYSAHNALADVQSLEILVMKTNISRDILYENRESIISSQNIYKFHQKSDYNEATMDCLKWEQVLSQSMIKKIAQSGLCLDHLKLAVTRNGLEGLRQLFSESLPNGKARVTNVKRIYESVCSYIQKI